MAVQGSGTQADPWTHVDLSAYDFCRMVTDGNTYYAKIGAHFNVTDSGDPSDEVDYFVGNVNPSTYGIYRSGWDLVGTCSTAGTVTIEVKEVWPEFEEEYSKTITLVILPSSSGPTLHVKVSGGSGRTISGSYDCQGSGGSSNAFPSSFQCNVGDTLDLTIDCECGGGITYTWSPSAPAGIRIDNASSAYPFYVRGTFQTAGTYTLHTDCNESGCVNIATFTVSNGGGWVGGKPFVKVNGAWKEATKVYIKVNGTWKESK